MLSLNSASNSQQLINQFNALMYDFDSITLKKFIEENISQQALIQMAYPFETLESRESLLEEVYSPLLQAIPDLEKRTYISMSGITNNREWVGCAGYYTGSFMEPWLDIPATGHQVFMRFHEFYCIENGKIVEIQSLWDIPQVMHQANCWPMSPSLGLEVNPPGPATLDGITQTPSPDLADKSLTTVIEMLTGLSRYAEGGRDAMELEKYWHPHSSWYGPSGIGTCRGVQGFRNWHQIPFLNALPDRRSNEDQGYLFADNNYVAFTAWPGMEMTVSGDGWLGIAPSNQRITMRSLDFWRCEDDKIRENWVLVDLLDVYNQLGVNVLARMKELNKARYRNFAH
ncbi:ester cyclase [Vibrio sp. SS-MA-C1-2]|uniref:ester cyclase n=1 Tax=Vibrio sp. SS-MA-C1-2 TaxID=2908646 RepID=UPI001F4676F2|nr:ester cyclase [Vibrio sp. SS-MA-C1-2]UJF17929.1 ester cyclase [Vibrio sp. SS-MA-C1-2]